MIMALPIKETPVLKGKDAKNFLREANKTKGKLGAEEVRRLKENYLKLKAISKF